MREKRGKGRRQGKALRKCAKGAIDKRKQIADCAKQNSERNAIETLATKDNERKLSRPFAGSR